jgi:signal transduction histidine kinase
MFDFEAARQTANGGSQASRASARIRSIAKGRILVVDNERFLRESLAHLLNERGYDVSFADDGQEALRLLRSEVRPDLIILDLRMPVMDGWEFRTIQKNDPTLGLIPVLVVSADGSSKAAAISAEGYLRKPFDSQDIMTAVERVLVDDKRRILMRQLETDRLTSLGRVAANVGHEINNPLTFVMLNLHQSLDELDVSLRSLDTNVGEPLPDAERATVKEHLESVTEMLRECEAGGERIRGTVTNLQQLSRKTVEQRDAVDMRELIEESASMARNQIRHRARLIKTFGEAAPVHGDRVALGQVLLNLLINAAHAIPEGDAERNEIRITTRVEAGINGRELVIEIRDSGVGMAPDVLSRIFEPYFTTKALGEGTGLGLSISRQTVEDHGGRLTVESELGTGTVFRVILPILPELPSERSSAARSSASPPLDADPAIPKALARGRVLVVDDEPFIGRVIQKALASEHDVVVVQRASEAFALLEQRETFDVVLCDLVMPDVSGPEFYARVAERWPELTPRLVFMTGGAFTPGTIAFMKSVPTEVLTKPFALDDLKRIVRDRVQGVS